jgi:hypothetical protein
MSTASAEQAPRLDAHAAWVRAEALAAAAVALLDDPTVPPWTAAAPLREGYAALASATGRNDADVVRSLADDDAMLDAATLRSLATALAHAVAAAGEATFAPGRRAQQRRRFRRDVLLGVLVLIVVAIGLVLTASSYREGPWRARYFANPDFEGTPIEVREGDVVFEWRRDEPIAGIPADGFSVRFETCMVLPEDLEVAFQLVSDDGSRLLVDGQIVVGNWGVHPKRSRGADVQLAAGVHHVRVDYFEAEKRAMIELLASLHGEVPTQLPVRLLHLPGDDPDDPCAGVTSP